MESYNGKGYGVYVYSTDTYIKNNWYKIGSTVRDFDERVFEQDVTAVPEPLRKLLTFSVEGYNITPKEFEDKLHEYFDNKGKRLRLDKDREWFYGITIDDIKIAIQTILVDPEAFKHRLILMPHQGEEMTTFEDGTAYTGALKFIKDRFKSGSRYVLLNHKPRSGKTFISYQDLIDEDYKNVLLLTNYPVLNGQWKDGGSNIYGFDYDIINVCSETITKEIMFDERPNFVMISFQDAKGKSIASSSNIPMLKDKFKILRGIKWDLIIVDECHRGKESELTDKLLGHLDYDRLLGLSATPTRNLLRGTFAPDDIHTYSISDEKRFKKLYPELYTLPDISFYLYNPSKTIKGLMQYYKDEEFFNWNKFFLVENCRLKYKTDIEIFFKWIAGFYGNNINMPLKKLSADSILMFVQSNECQPLLVEVLNSIDFYRNNYNIHYTNSEVNTNSADLLWKTKNEFIPRDGKKSIVIANRQLTTGVTLPQCDMVMFMNDWASMDEYIQASYRCQSAMKGKTNCSVIDFTPYRTFKIFKEFIEVNYLSGGKSLEERYVEFFDSLSIFECNEDGQFKTIDVDGFKNKIVDIMDISSRNFFGSYLIRKDEVERDCAWLVDKLGHIDGGDGGSETKVRLDDNGIEKGKTKQTLGEKKDKIVEESDKKLLWALENIEYFLGKTPLLSICCDYKIDNLDDCLDYIHSNVDREKNFVDFISLDRQLNIDFATADFIFRNYINIELLNDRILTFNIKMRGLIYTENKSLRVINIEKVLGLIESYVGISKLEKKMLGEVFTPFSLIGNMINTFQEEDWSNPNLTWFGPASGCGNFQIVIVQRLMNGLESWEPDEEKRYKHIIENQIYVNEYQPKNMFIYLQLFDPNNEYKMNWNRGDYLTFDFEKKWGFKPDRIVENSPYQLQQIGNKKTQSLWDKFVKKSLETLKEDGYMVMVHPSGWRNVAGAFKSTQNLLKSKQMLFLKMHSFKDGQNMFNAAINFDYYCLRNSNNNNFITKIICEDNEEYLVDISKMEFIPSENITEIYNLVAKEGEEKVQIIGDSNYHTQKLSQMSKEKTEEFKHPCVYTVTSPIKSLEKGNKPTFWYSNINKGHFGIPKLIWANGASGILIDKNGEYGLTQFGYAIVDNPENFENIKKVMQSEKFIKRIMMFKNSLGDKYNRKVISTFRKDFWKDPIFKENN